MEEKMSLYQGVDPAILRSLEYIRGIVDAVSLISKETGEALGIASAHLEDLINELEA